MILGRSEILNFLSAEDYLVVQNPAMIEPSQAIYPLRKAIREVEDVKAILMDMDGTTTTTEELCLYSLEEMVRKMSGNQDRESWKGIEKEKDYPFIIGNSTTKHVEYLIEKYGKDFVDENISSFFIDSAIWTLKYGQDKNRVEEVKNNLRNQNLGFLNDNFESISDKEIEAVKADLKIDKKDWVVVGVDIYYHKYHQILLELLSGNSKAVKEEVFGEIDSDSNIISPMPAIEVLLPLIKGWLGEEVEIFAEYVYKLYKKENKLQSLSDFKESLLKLSNYFEKNNVKLGLVTSSILYEAEIVITEVFNVVSDFIENSELSADRKAMILNHLKDKSNVYDAFITATVTHEIKLKPHPDLYSIAMYQMGIEPKDFDKVIGFEDSRSGTEAIRAAGIQCCVAVPFSHTSNHNLDAASVQVEEGIPQILIDNNLCIKIKE